MVSDRRAFIRGTLTGGLIATAGLAKTIPANAQALTPAEAKQIAEDAYVYGYSLITTEVTRVQMTNVAKVGWVAARRRTSSPTFRAIRRRTIAAFPRRMPTRSIRWPGSTSPSRRCSAIRTWATASTCSRSSISG